MRQALLLFYILIPCYSQPLVLYAAAGFASNYVVGGKLPESGLFRRDATGAWHHAGYNLPVLSALSGDPRNRDGVLIAAGNGLIRALSHGEKWTILTGNDVTELRDVAVDGTGTIYFAHTRGIRVSHDGGASWSELTGSWTRKFAAAIRTAGGGVLVAGAENGIYRSEDDGGTWQLAGAAGWQILRIERSPHDGCFWLASTQGGGLFASRDCGKTFENTGPLGVDRNIYDIAFDPGKPGRIAVGGFGPGVAVSENYGKTWELRNAGLPAREVSAVIFEPGKAGRLYAAVHEAALYVSDDAGVTWRKDSLEGSRVYCLRFLPEVSR